MAKPAPKTQKRVARRRPAAGSQTKRVPLVVVTGYLGAGKTTLLHQLLPHLRGSGRKGLLLVNEIGDVSIDGALLGDSGMEQKDLLGGCVCCSLTDDLYMSIRDGLASYKPDFVLLETSGLSEPEQIVDAATSPGLAKLVEVTDVVTVVDSANLELQLRHSELSRRQIDFASSLVLSKADVADPDVLERAREKLAEYAPEVPVTLSAMGEVDVDRVLWRTDRYLSGVGYEELAHGKGECDHDHGVCNDPEHHHHDHDHGHHHDHDHDHEHHHHAHLGTHAGHYAINVELPDEVEANALLDCLNLLPETAYRVKGFARVKGQPRPWIFQRVGETAPQAMPFTLDKVFTPIGMVVIGPRLTTEMIEGVVKPIGGRVLRRTS